MGTSPLRLFALAGAALLAACGGGEEPASSADAFSFIVVGDTPNGPEDEAMLAEAVPLIKASRTPFVIHLGDYKSGGASCTDDHDAAFATLIEDLKPIPVFYTPGDNEWTDCDRNINEDTGRYYSDLDRLERVRTLFFSEPPGAPDAMQYRRQEAQVENATWTHDGVRFATVHVVGTNNGRNWVVGDSLLRAAEAVAARDAANLDWVEQVFRAARGENARAVIIAMQATPVQVWEPNRDISCNSPDVDPIKADGNEVCDGFFDLRVRLRNEALDFGGPVLVVHGDTAPFTLNQDFLGEDAPNLWRFNAAGDAGIGRTGLPYGLRDVSFVTVDPSARAPFSAVALLSGKKPKKK